MKNLKLLAGITGALLLGAVASACSGSDSSPGSGAAGSGGSTANLGGASGSNGRVDGVAGKPVAAAGSGGNASSAGSGGSAGNPTVPVFFCDERSPETLASTVAAGWELVESIAIDSKLDKELRAVDYRIGVGPDGRIVGFDGSDGLLLELGTWPNIGRTGRTLDPLVPEHRKLNPDFNVQGAPIFDEGTLIFAYNFEDLDSVHGAGVFIDDGKSQKAFVASQVGSARRAGNRLLVAAGGFLNQGSTAREAPQQVWSMNLDAAPAAFKSVEVTAGFAMIGMHALGDDMLFNVYTSASPAEKGEFAIHSFTKQALKEAQSTLTMPAPAASIYEVQAEDTRDSFDIEGGVVMLMDWENLPPSPTKIEVVRNSGGTLTAEEPLLVDTRCMVIRSGFAVAGDLVIYLQERNLNEGRLLRLRAVNR